MINSKKVIVVLPAYNAATTLEKTYREIPFNVVDETILVDDGSQDETLSIAKHLGITESIKHNQNIGYGGNQKTCFDAALERNADIVILLHPDYQYSPKLITPMCQLISNDLHDVVLGSRILGGGALSGGMPYYKYFANRALTAFQNLLISQKLSEYHTGYRAYSAQALRTINYHKNSDDFIFDNQILSQLLMKRLRVGEISCPTRYEKDSSSINFLRSVAYGCGVLHISIRHMLHRNRLASYQLYTDD